MELKDSFIKKAAGCNGSFKPFSVRRQSAESCSGTSISVSKSGTLSEQNSLRHFSAFCDFNETDRLMSDQGLITPKRRASVSRRQIRDKSYYKGEIRIKGKEICDEIKKLKSEINVLSIDQSTYIPYKKKAELKAMELKKFQNMLADYNLVDDMLNTDTSLEEATEELRNLKVKNNQENAEVEKLFNVKKLREEVLKELETDMNQEEYVSEILSITISSQLREKYVQLKRLDDKLQATWFDQDKELEELLNKEKILENQCNENDNLEVLQGLKKLKIFEDKREDVFSEKTFSSLSLERKYLQKHYGECTDLVKIMSQETRNLENKIKEAKCELAKNVDGSADLLYSERREKYLRLKKKENAMDDFISNWNAHQTDMLTDLKQLECKVSRLLEDISKTLNMFNLDVVDTMKGGVESDVSVKSKLFLSVLDLNRNDNLLKKLNEELQSVKDSIAAKKKDMAMYSDIKSSEKEMKMKECKLVEEKLQVQKQKKVLQLIIEDLQKHHNYIQSKLNKNETYKKLLKLEKKWHLLEEENFALENVIESEKVDANYIPVKENVKRIYSELNSMLKNF